MFRRRALEHDDERYTRYRRGLNFRRLIGGIIILAVIWGIIWLCFFSGFAEPIITTAEPIISKAAALINDPVGIDWGGWLVGIAIVAIPHIAFLFFIFDDSMR